MTRPSGIFSTTRTYNPGDEFILFGIESLIHDIIGPFNTVFYNRNPAVQNFRMTFDKEATVGTQTANWYQTLRHYFSERENSWSPELGIKFADFVIFAGTPEWVGRMVEPLTSALKEFNGPVLYLGLGSMDIMEKRKFSDLLESDQVALKKAALITVRDTPAANFLNPLSPHILPCPSLFACEGTLHKNKQRIAVSLQGTKNTNTQRIDPAVRDYMLALLNCLNDDYSCAVIAHYVDELPELADFLPSGVDLIFHSDSRSYMETYDAFDLVVTTRVHGAGLAAALGVPSFVISHSHRSQTAEGFLAEMINPDHETPDDAVKRLKKFDNKARSQELLAHQKQSRETYLDLLRSALSPLSNCQSG